MALCRKKLCNHAHKIGSNNYLKLIFFFWLATHSVASATVVFIDDIQTMTRKSDVVIQAVVRDQSIKDDGKGRIITLTTLEIIDGIKGAKTGDHITVYQVGGELAGRVLRVSGAHHYKPGEEIMLFGLRLRDAIVSYGLGLGKFKVLRDDRGIRVVEDLHDLIAIKPGANGRNYMGEPEAREFPSLEAFKGQIYEALMTPRLILNISPMRLHPISKLAAAKNQNMTGGGE